MDPRLLGTVEYLHLFHFSLVFLIWGKLLWIFIDKWDLIVLNLIVSNLLKQRFWFVENNFSQIVFNFQANLNLSLQNLQNREHYRYFSALLLDTSKAICNRIDGITLISKLVRPPPDRMKLIWYCFLFTSIFYKNTVYKNIRLKKLNFKRTGNRNRDVLFMKNEGYTTKSITFSSPKSSFYWRLFAVSKYAYRLSYIRIFLLVLPPWESLI